MTLRQLFREFVLAKQRREEERDRDISHAWHVAAFSRQDKLPRLETLLVSKSQPSRQQTQTVSEQRTMLEALSQMIGVPLRHVTPRARA